jgi:hypothetical protein
MKYTFEGEMPLNEDKSLDLSRFTGSIETFNNLGELTGTIILNSGEIIAVEGQNSPCPDDEVDDDDDDPDDTSTTGGGANAGDGTNTNIGGGATGGGEYVNPDDEEGCEVYLVTPTCECEGNLVGPHDCTLGSNSYLVVRCGSFVTTTTHRGASARELVAEDPCGYGDTGVLIDLNKNHINNCEKLQALIDSPSVKNKIQDLKNNLPSESDENADEKGFVIATDSNDGLIGGSVVSGSTGEFNFVPYNNVVGGGCFHSNDLYPMFSFEDLLLLHKIYGSYTNNDEELEVSDPILILITPPNSSPKVYAIKIKDLASLAIFAGSLTEGKIKEYKRSMFNKYKFVKNSVGGESPAKYQKALLEFLNTPNLGISLYQASDDLTGWTEKQLSDNLTSVEDNNCN